MPGSAFPVAAPRPFAGGVETAGVAGRAVDRSTPTAMARVPLCVCDSGLPRPEYHLDAAEPKVRRAIESALVHDALTADVRAVRRSDIARRTSRRRAAGAWRAYRETLSSVMTMSLCAPRPMCASGTQISKRIPRVGPSFMISSVPRTGRSEPIAVDGNEARTGGDGFANAGAGVAGVPDPTTSDASGGVGADITGAGGIATGALAVWQPAVPTLASPRRARSKEVRPPAGASAAAKGPGSGRSALLSPARPPRSGTPRSDADHVGAREHGRGVEARSVDEDAVRAEVADLVAGVRRRGSRRACATLRSAATTTSDAASRPIAIPLGRNRVFLAVDERDEPAAGRRRRARRAGALRRGIAATSPADTNCVSPALPSSA